MSLLDAWATTYDFVETGGRVLPAILAVTFLMWILIIERLIFMMTENRIRLRTVLSDRESRPDRWSWHARAIHEAAVSEVSMRFNSGIPMIQTLWP